MTGCRCTDDNEPQNANSLDAKHLVICCCKNLNIYEGKDIFINNGIPAHILFWADLGLSR